MDVYFYFCFDFQAGTECGLIGNRLMLNLITNKGANETNFTNICIRQEMGIYKPGFAQSHKEELF